MKYEFDPSNPYFLAFDYFAASGHLNQTFLTCKPSKLFTSKTKLIYTKDCFKMSPLLLIC